MKKLGALLAATAVFACAATAGQARANSEFATETVRFSDLSAGNVPGAAHLFSRIQAAAVHVCGRLPMSGSVGDTLAHRKCLHQAVANAVATVDLPTLSAFATDRGVVLPAAALRVARRE